MNISLEEFNILASSIDIKDNIKAVKFLYELLRVNYREDIIVNGNSLSFKDDPDSIENAYAVLFELINQTKQNTVFTDLPGRI